MSHVAPESRRNLARQAPICSSAILAILAVPFAVAEEAIREVVVTALRSLFNIECAATAMKAAICIDWA